MKTLLGTTALLLALTSCGGADKNAHDTSPPAASTSCSDIWVAGETLPADYDGCEISADMLEAPVVSECTDGSKWTGYDDQFYAKLGGKIHQASGAIADDPAYKAFVEQCSGAAIGEVRPATEKPTVVVERWLAAYDNGDVETACSLQTDRYTRGEAVLAAHDGWASADATCPEFVTAVAQMLDSTAGLGSYDATQVRATNRSALVAVAFADTTDARYHLLRVHGQWLIDEELHPELK